MTEEIIVERCKFITSDGFCKSPINTTKYCDEIPEEWCCYKQLQRLKQENEKLKEEIKTQHDNCKGCPSYFDAINNAKNYRDDKNIYRKALEEIREMCKTMLQGVTSNCINNTPYLIALNSMENKINEVLNDKEL